MTEPDKPTPYPWHAHYDPGVPTSLKYPPVPLFNFLEEAARKYPNVACTHFEGVQISYRQMSSLTDRLAAGLAARGVNKGDRVGIFMSNIPQFVIAFFAILKAGGVVVATNPLYSPPEIEHQVKDAGIEVMFVTSKFYARIKDIQPQTKLRLLVLTDINESRLLAALTPSSSTSEVKADNTMSLQAGDVWMRDLIAPYSAKQRPRVQVGPEDIALIQYSGGTTGIAKGAVALHRNLVANTLQVRCWWVTTEEGKETVLIAIPLYHVYGMVNGMCLGMLLGASLVLVPDPRDLDDVLSNVATYKVTIFPAVPTLFNAINNHPAVKAGRYDLSSVKACISGSAPLMRETKERFESLTGGKLIEGYGLSEAPTATHCNPVLGMNKLGSIGIPLTDVTAKIIDLEDETTEVPQGQIGELVVRGPQVMLGYHNMPSETANSLRDGWLYTGDIAYMDSDGYFFLVDRKKELIKSSGFQVWPREVEEAIVANPKVLDVCVAGVPDPYRGETVKAWVVLNLGETAEAEEIKAWCKERLAAYKIPTHIEFRTELPKTTIGKTLRCELVRQHLEKSHE